nr:LysR substrate-binding domain-containing protein [Streptomyces antimycoticus]
MTAGADFVRHGLGIALLPRGVVGPHDDLTTLPITGAELDWSISMAIPDNRTPSAAAGIRAVCRSAPEVTRRPAG